MNTLEDKHGGITIDYTTLPDNCNHFKEQLSVLLRQMDSKKLLWVKVPVAKSEFIPFLTCQGFAFHHCNESFLMLVKRLQKDAYVPTAMNYLVGVGAIVLDGNKLLVIKDRFSQGYKLPGGHIDSNEKIKDALEREVFEETGIHIEFESIVNLGHFTQGQFGESNLYIVCTAKALSKDISINDSNEILEAKWIDIEEFLLMKDTNNYNRSVVKATLENECLKLTEQQVELKISGGEVFY